ncbi:MAG: hypothetical protein IPH84_19695 [Bacteroidales bacterium]|nr:hypothetical protein [Bacteroidales bacterium]
MFDSISRYKVLLTASDTNQCADTLRAMVDVEPSPLSAFSYTDDVEQVQGQVQFSDGSIGPMNTTGTLAMEKSHPWPPVITYRRRHLYRDPVYPE